MENLFLAFDGANAPKYYVFENIMENGANAPKSKCSIFHNIFKYIVFQTRQKALLWSKGLSILARLSYREY